MDDGTLSTYTKTKNEIGLDEYEQIEKFFPKLIVQVGDI